MADKFILVVMWLCADRKGVTAIEYALIATFIAVAIIAGATTLGTNINGRFVSIAGKV